MNTQTSLHQEFKIAALIAVAIAVAITVGLLLFLPTESYATNKERVLAQMILDNPNINKSGRLVLADLQAAARGKKGTSGHHLSENLLRMLVALGKNHTYTITALESGGTGHSPGSEHYKGLAVDIGAFDGKPVLGRNPPSIQIIKILDDRMPPGSWFGQSNCGPTPPLPPGVGTFKDTCNHLHIQVSR